MRTRRIGLPALVLVLVTYLALPAPSLEAQASRDVTREIVDEWMAELSNWGRWGDDDQLGTINLITPKARQRALALATTGVSVSLSHDYLKEPSEDATRPIGHMMLGVDRPGPFRSDQYTFAYHGYAHSHMDSLCHMMHDGRMYNGFLRDDEVTTAGCAKLAIINFKQGIVTRGILMDIARLRGVDYLEPGTPIHVEDLEAWERQAGITVESGDIVLCTKWPLGATCRNRAVGHGPRIGGPPCLGRALAARARRRDVGKRWHQRRAPLWRRRGRATDSPAHARRHGDAALRQPGPGSGRCRSGTPEPVGVSTRRRAAGRRRRNRIAAQSAGESSRTRRAAPAPWT